MKHHSNILAARASKARARIAGTTLAVGWALLSATSLYGQSPAQTNRQSVVVTPDFLGQLAEEMRTNHPALRAADARTAAAGHATDAVRTWEDPMARLGGMAAEKEMRAEDGDLVYGIEQKLPLFGKPRLERRMVAAEAETESANTEYEFQRLRSEFAQAAFQTALANEIVRIGEEDLSWLTLMNQTIESKYRAGEATLVEVLQVQNEEGKRATALQSDRNQIRHEEVTLNRFLHRDQQAPWPSLELPEPAGPIHFNRRLIEFALQYEPKSQVIRQQIKQSQAGVDLARRERFPDVNVGLEARNYTGDGSFRQGMLVFSMNLPWVNARKYRSEVKREQARLTATEMELEDYQSALREELHLLTVRIDAARREALLYRDEILPRTRAAMESARSSWEANRGSVRDTLEARRMLLDARLMYARAVTEQYRMLSDLVLCCGLGDLNALEMLGALPDASADKPGPTSETP